MRYKKTIAAIIAIIIAISLAVQSGLPIYAENDTEHQISHEIESKDSSSQSSDEGSEDRPAASDSEKSDDKEESSGDPGDALSDAQGEASSSQEQDASDPAAQSDADGNESEENGSDLHAEDGTESPDESEESDELGSDEDAQIVDEGETDESLMSDETQDTVADLETEAETETEMEIAFLRAMRSTTTQVNLAETDWIKSIDIRKLNTSTGQWESGTTVFKNGDTVRIQISYSIPHHALDSYDTELLYQLPDGVTLENEQAGEVYSHDGSAIGTYVISTDGEISILFNDAFDPTITEIGIVSLQGMLLNDSTQEDKVINFPGTGTNITIQKKEEEIIIPPDQSDISVNKSAEVSGDKKKITYTVVASTEKGTSDTVNVIDAFTWGNHADAAYDAGSFRIVKTDKNGVSQAVDTGAYPPEIGTNASGLATFTIRALPQLLAGESYQITYTADIQTSGEWGGEQSLNNQVKGESGGKTDYDTVNTEISKSMVSKSGYASNGYINWTIRVNGDERDLSKYKLSDVLPEGTKVSGEIQIRNQRTWALVSGLTNAGDGSESIEIDFSKLDASQRQDQFVITFATNAPTVSGDDSVKVENTAIVQGDSNKYESTGTIYVSNGKLSVNKRFDKETVLSGGKSKYTWWSTLSLSGTETSGFMYRDVIANAVSEDEDGTQTDQNVESHYTTAKTLVEELSSYKARILRKAGNNGGYTDYEAGKDYTYTITCYDEEGNVIPNDDSEQHVKSFTVEVKAVEGKSISPTTFNIQYSTIADTGSGAAGETWTYANTGEITESNGNKIDDVKSTASTTHTTKKRLRKEAGFTGEGYTYSSADQTAELEKTEGLVYYRILLNIDKDTSGEIVVEDILSEGLEFEEGSLAAAFYGNNWYTYPSIKNGAYDLSAGQKPALTKEMQSDGSTKLVITIPAGYEDSSERTIQLTYRASVKEDKDWLDMKNESKSYYNTASWKDSQDTQTTTFTREVDVVKKSAKQLTDSKGKLTNVLEYKVDINPAGLNLNPNSNTLILKDQLTLPEGVGAYLDLTQTGLYKYDSSKPDHVGDKLDPGLYKLFYDDETHQITLEVADAQASVLVYRYNIDPGNYESPEISNKAELAGNYSSSNSIHLQSDSSSAMIYGKQLVLFKVDSDDYTSFLPGASFSVEEWENGSWHMLEPEEISSSKKLVTDHAGKLALTNLKDNTLYRIKEVEAPAGYAISKKPVYVIWKEEGSSNSELYDALDESAKNEIQDIKYVHFVTDIGGYLYVPNTFMNFSVEKHWLNKDGTPGKAGANKITAHLYSTSKVLNGVTVKVQVLDPWNRSLNASAQIAKGTAVRVFWNQYTSSGIQSIKINGVDVNDSDAIGTISFTSPAILEDTTIEIKTLNYTSMPLLDYENPQYLVDKSERQLVETFTLSEADGWSKQWTDLPRTDDDGKELVYFVEEDLVEGYHTSYMRNDGAQTGKITIINRKNEDDYQLPLTGSRNAVYVLLFGITSVIFGLIRMVRARKYKF